MPDAEKFRLARESASVERIVSRLAKFSELSGMTITDMGEFNPAVADNIAQQIDELLGTLEVPIESMTKQTKWICPVCGYAHTGEEPPRPAHSASSLRRCLRGCRQVGF